MIPHRILAALADAACIVVFVLAGHQSHDVTGGAGWFLTVAWPFAAGWLVVAAVTRLYTCPDKAWIRLVATWIAGTTVALLLRGLVTGRPVPVAFVVVALAFLGATTAGWRMVPMLVSRWRGRGGQARRVAGN